MPPDEPGRRSLRAMLLRSDRVILAFLLVLPLGISSLLGFVWLHERGWLLWFALGSTGFFSAVRLGLALARRVRPVANGGDNPRDLVGPEADPAWSDAERAAYDRARARIAGRLRAPIPWADLPAEALVTVEEVAADLSGGRRGMLDFTLPEALLLIDRVALRYRAFLLTHVPWSDRLSVRALHWIWRNHETATTALETGSRAWRGVRLILNPAVALLREAERALATRLQDRLTDGFRRDAQAILLEEAALAAIDLYSGRLTFHESDLAVRNDLRPLPHANPEMPVQIVLIGQAGAGKSRLLDALLGEGRGGTMDGSVTERVKAARLAPGVNLVDTPGLDGSDKRRRASLATLAEADLVLWVHRANRPGRAPDADLAQDLAAMARSTGRAIPVLHVATAADLVHAVPGHPTSAADRQRIADAIAPVLTLLPGPLLPVDLRDPPRGLDALRAAIDNALPEARQARQRRLGRAMGGVRGLKGNLRRAGRGFGAVAGLVFRRPGG